MSVDWSDHALWWPQKNVWLTRTRSTLDQYGVQADAILHFTPMHKTLRVQLPDLRYVDARVDFSIKCFTSVVQLCKDFNIRHPEEMSFCRPLAVEHLKKNVRNMGASPRQRAKDTMGPIIANNGHDYSVNSISTPDGKSTPGLGDDGRSSTPLWNRNGSANGNNGRSTPSVYANGIGNGNTSMTAVENFNNSSYVANDLNVINLSISPSAPTLEARTSVLRPKSLVERARLNSGWLDSSLSLYEQDVREYDLLQLKFKFYSFYDLNAKQDAARINQIYEQARWAILNEEIDCTEEEMMMFAALQLQVNLQSNDPLPERTQRTSNDDDIDSALNDLQQQLEGSNLGGSNGHSGGDSSYEPELADYLKFMKPRRFTLKSFKRLYFVFKDTRLSVYKSRDDRFGEPAFSINLRGCELTPDVNLSQSKYGIKLEVPNIEGMTEYWLRCEAEEQYAKWMAACRMASKGRTMADSSYESEVKQILDFLSIQHPALAPVISAHQVDINPDDYVAGRFSRKLKGRGQVSYSAISLI